MVSLATLVLAGCASSGPTLSTAERLQLYQQKSSPAGPIRVDTRGGRVTSWTSLGDQALTVFGESGRTYLIQLRSRCSGLEVARTIRISNSAGMVAAGFDSVRPLGAGGQPTSTPPCRIASTRVIDRRAVQEAKAEMREASLVERDPNYTPDN